MTVAELMEQLSGLPQDAEVYVMHDEKYVTAFATCDGVGMQTTHCDGEEELEKPIALITYNTSKCISVSE